MTRSLAILLALVIVAVAAGIFVMSPSGRNPSGADVVADLAALEPYRQGDMVKLRLGEADGSDAAFIGADGSEMTLAAYKGKFVLVNFWATWCAPCREEMPQLAELQSDFGGDAFEVVTIATGRNAPPAMAAFFDEIGVDNLPLHRDPGQDLARDFGVLGLPVTVILDPSGREIGRLQGEADWAADEAKALIAAMLGV